MKTERFHMTRADEEFIVTLINKAIKDVDIPVNCFIEYSYYNNHRGRDEEKTNIEFSLGSGKNVLIESIASLADGDEGNVNDLRITITTGNKSFLAHYIKREEISSQLVDAVKNLMQECYAREKRAEDRKEAIRVEAIEKMKHELLQQLARG